ncbi:HNH endonuclease signature motif containing protein [Glycomyces buryatensis]|uniref:DUF222 domain-containing protein n=1 Tax=Glycomyces buryatensis TaxID=2570927 RepID=A0A4S8QHY5_9ACTN|nr:HNH endonuclease signature motif containing protein [Glycomyces buryatensis]THV43361.1 DUF222 domain-containing protein [Glycomyces buryatensis]
MALSNTTPLPTQTATGPDRRGKSEAIHTLLDEQAALINGAHASVLSSVIEAKTWNIHRDFDGFSALRDWLVSTFDFCQRTAADLAAIAGRTRKFTLLSEAATSQSARIDQVAFAVRQLDKTPAMRLYARTPYRQPVASPFDPAVSCPTPEALVAQYCAHAPFEDLKAHLAEIEASLADSAELFEGLGEQSLQHLDIWEQDNGMWGLAGQLSADTGALFAKMLATAVPPPRQDETDQDGDLPAASNRNAEALHQMLAAYGTNPAAPTRHGHTATLSLSCDIETLRGDVDLAEAPDRTPRLDGQPISVAKARLLACEAGVIPMVYDYATGEVVELGREERLPSTALRRKLEAEQPGGCAWFGCSRPVAWTEAHHIVHWADGGNTNADNLILLCRFHHGRIHTPGWTVTKTGPGAALIVHHDHADLAAADMAEYAEGDHGCGCADHRSSEDLEVDFRGGIDDAFPTGIYPEEQTEITDRDLKTSLDAYQLAQVERCIKRAKAKARYRFSDTGNPKAVIADRLGQPPGALPCPAARQQEAAGDADQQVPQPDPPGNGTRGSGPSSCRRRHYPPPSLRPRPGPPRPHPANEQQAPAHHSIADRFEANPKHTLTASRPPSTRADLCCR